MRPDPLQVSEAIELINQALDQVFPFILVEGEVASFKVNQNKFIFFDVKDEAGSIGCFMMAFSLKFPIEDGMKVRILAQPKLTKWGKFSLTVREVMPVGEGSLKKSFEILKNKLENEGLFDETRKRPLPVMPRRIGVVSSSGAAGYTDFLKILQNRWGGLEIILADVPVQGIEAPAEIIGALKFLNEQPEPLDVIAVVRGGGSADDLSSFNHEDVVRAVALSRTPVIVGVGHEVDVSLSDLAADRRAATPSNAAEILVPEKQEVLQRIERSIADVNNVFGLLAENLSEQAKELAGSIEDQLNTFIKVKLDTVLAVRRSLSHLNPELVLRRGYSLVRKNGKLISTSANVTIGDRINIQFSDGAIGAEVTDANK